MTTTQRVRCSRAHAYLNRDYPRPREGSEHGNGFRTVTFEGDDVTPRG